MEVGQIEGGGELLDFCRVLDEGDYFHIAAAFVADERVDFVNFLNDSSPGF